MRHHPLASLLIFAVLPAAAAPTLNDTGQTTCFDGSSMVGCSETSTGDSSSYPRQDGRFGRDALAGAAKLTKKGAGDVGFDYTKIANDGSALPDTATHGTAAKDWACTKDNTTGLVWEVKTTDGGLRDQGWYYSWYSTDSNSNGGNPGYPGHDFNCGYTLSQCNTSAYVAAVNTKSLCGSNKWRVPSVSELQGIVHFGKMVPSIEPSFFEPSAFSNSSWSWTASNYAPDAGFAWVVYFTDGGVYYGNKGYDGITVRVVSSSQ
ncbi:conserved exported hypothetical protein [Gammaproteobacteria bacterium]